MTRTGVSMQRTGRFLSLLLASAVVRSRAVAVDRPWLQSWRSQSPAGRYLDCSWGTRDVKHFKYRGRHKSLWPCRETKLAKLSHENNKGTVVCIGDSITKGIGVNWMEAYPHQLYLQLRQQYNVVNLGVASASLQRFSNSSYWDFPHWTQALQGLRNVQIVIVQLGSNDAQIGMWNRTAFRDDYVLMLQFLKKMYPRAAIITSIPPPCVKLTFYHVQPEIVKNELKSEIITARIMAGLEGPPVNMQSSFAAENATAPSPLLQTDGLHPSSAGHAVMSSTLVTAIAGMK